MPEKNTSKQMTELNEKLDQLLSYKQVFIRGIIRGVAIAIGTTIVAAIILSVLGALFDPFDNLPILRDIVQTVEKTSLSNVDHSRPLQH